MGLGEPDAIKYVQEAFGEGEREGGDQGQEFRMSFWGSHRDFSQ